MEVEGSGIIWMLQVGFLFDVVKQTETRSQDCIILAYAWRPAKNQPKLRKLNKYAMKYHYQMHHYYCVVKRLTEWPAELLFHTYASTVECDWVSSSSVLRLVLSESPENDILPTIK